MLLLSFLQRKAPRVEGQPPSEQQEESLWDLEWRVPEHGSQEKEFHRLRSSMIFPLVLLLLFFLIIALLRCNPHVVTSILLKCTGQQVLEHAQGSAFITTVYSRTFSSPLKETAYRLVIIPPGSLPPAPGNQLIDFLSK